MKRETRTFHEIYDSCLLNLPHAEFSKRMRAEAEATDRAELLRERLRSIELFRRRVREEEKRYFVHDPSSRRTHDRLAEECDSKNRLAGARRFFVNAEAQTQKRRGNNKHSYDVYTFYTVELERVCLVDEVERAFLDECRLDPVREARVLGRLDAYLGFFLTAEGQRTGTFDRSNGVWYHDALLEDALGVAEGELARCMRGTGELRRIMRRKAPHREGRVGPLEVELDGGERLEVAEGYARLGLRPETRI